MEQPCLMLTVREMNYIPWDNSRARLGVPGQRHCWGCSSLFTAQKNKYKSLYL